MSLFDNIFKTDKNAIELSEGELFQPVRLHVMIKKEPLYKILKGKTSSVYESHHKCFLLQHPEELTFEKPTDKRFRDLWEPSSVARLFFEGPHKMYVLAPSYERATDAAIFLTQPMVKKYARLTAADVCVKLYENTKEHVKALRRINFFEDKNAEKSIMEKATSVATQRYKGNKEDVEAFTKELRSAFLEQVEKGLPEVEHWDLKNANQPLLDVLEDRFSNSRFIANRVFEGRTSEIFDE